MTGLEELEAMEGSLDNRDLLWYFAHPVRPSDEEVAAVVRCDQSGDPLPNPGPELVTEQSVERARMYAAHDRFVAYRGNIINAYRWLSWLARRFPSLTFIASWISSLDGGGGDDFDPASRSRGIRDCCRTVRRCDGIVLGGTRVSPGMFEEAGCARRVIDLTTLGIVVPLHDGGSLVDGVSMKVVR